MGLMRWIGRLLNRAEALQTAQTRSAVGARYLFNQEQIDSARDDLQNLNVEPAEPLADADIELGSSQRLQTQRLEALQREQRRRRGDQ